MLSLKALKNFLTMVSGTTVSKQPISLGFLDSSTALVAFNHKNWQRYQTYDPTAGGKAPEWWWYKHDKKVMACKDYQPAINSDQAGELLVAFDLLGSNRDVFEKILEEDGAEIKTFANLISAKGPHAVTNIAILIACRSICLEHRYYQRSLEARTQSPASMLH